MSRLASTIMRCPMTPMAKAVAGRRLKCGFQGYTTDAAPVLIGFGASAIGSLPQGYVQNASAAAAYAKEIESGRLAAVRGVALTVDDRLRREAIERLMCDLEVDLEAVGSQHGADPAPLKEAAAIGLLRFICDGLAHWDGRRVRVASAAVRLCGRLPLSLTVTSRVTPQRDAAHAQYRVERLTFGARP
jgi:oxygen-independent coproporphyrinogen III oxidase